MKWGIINILTVLLLASSTLGWHVSPSSVLEETCDNAIDDDGDGLIDLNDPDCECATVEPLSLIPNPSFEEHSCCPGNNSQLSCAVTWIQASDATTDYINTCGWMGWDYMPMPLPIPDGEGCVGYRNGRFTLDQYTEQPEPNWKEYAGACLLSPLRADNSYTFRFYIGFSIQKHSPPTEVVFYGTTDCKNLPFGMGDRTFGCPTNDPKWERIGSVYVNIGHTWAQREITFTPKKDYTAIAIGPSCKELVELEDTYYFFDNLVLADQKAFEFQVTEKGNPCVDSFALQIPYYDTLQYQWYYDGVAILGATESTLHPISKNGNYQVRLTSSEGCKTTNDFFFERPFSFEEQEVLICQEDIYRFHSQFISESGVYTETLKSVDNCDSIIQLNLKVTTDQVDTVVVKLFPGETYQAGAYEFREAGEHLAYLESVVGCDSVVNVSLDFYQVFVPNAFSPNGDGFNDTFTIFSNSDLVRIESMRVFSRWGRLMYEGTDMEPNDDSIAWDGHTHQGLAPEGVYIFTMSLLMEDGIVREQKGVFSLVR